MLNTLSLYRPQNDDHRFLNSRQFAKALGVSVSTLLRGRKAGKYPFSACIRISPRRIIYDSCLLQDLTVKAGIQTGLKGEADQ
jgi:hypothetical protein